MPDGQALLALEDGTTFRGHSFGATGTATGEVVFNTAMTGYVEVLSDPSYRGQMVAMTYPLIGNYGVTPDDFESRGLWLSAFLVKEVARRASNWRSRTSLPDLLRERSVLGISGLDTRCLVRHIREAGAMKAAASTEILGERELVTLARESPGLVGRDLVREVACTEGYAWTEPLADRAAAPPRYDVVVMDYGLKRNILRLLVTAGCRVRVMPAYATAEEVLALEPDGVMLSNGPGDPAALESIVEEVRKMLGRVPLFGICLGHQILGQAMGGRTSKLKFGHHGANHPVMRLGEGEASQHGHASVVMPPGDLAGGHVEITSQNHGFVVDLDSLPDGAVEVTHVNLNDRTVEGLRCRDVPAFSVQYHPEAAPGPHDSRYLFEMFTRFMKAQKS